MPRLDCPSVSAETVPLPWFWGYKVKAAPDPKIFTPDWRLESYDLSLAQAKPCISIRLLYS